MFIHCSSNKNLLPAWTILEIDKWIIVFLQDLKLLHLFINLNPTFNFPDIVTFFTINTLSTFLDGPERVVHSEEVLRLTQQLEKS